MEDIQYCGKIASVLWGIAAVHVGEASVLWRVGFSTAEGIQYSGDNNLKYYEFSSNLQIFSRAYFVLQSDLPHRRHQVLTTADMVKDLGYKNLVLGEIPL